MLLEYVNEKAGNNSNGLQLQLQLAGVDQAGRPEDVVGCLK